VLARWRASLSALARLRHETPAADWQWLDIRQKILAFLLGRYDLSAGRGREVETAAPEEKDAPATPVPRVLPSRLAPSPWPPSVPIDPDIVEDIRATVSSIADANREQHEDLLRTSDAALREDRARMRCFWLACRIQRVAPIVSRRSIERSTVRALYERVRRYQHVGCRRGTEILDWSDLTKMLAEELDLDPGCIDPGATVGDLARRASATAPARPTRPLAF
jgi:hypothetical protein